MSAKPNHKDLEGRIGELEKEVAHCRRLQAAIWSERRQLLALLNGFPAYVFGETADHTIHYANDFFRERFGNPTGERCTEFFEQIGGSRSQCLVPEIVREMRPRSWEWHDAPNNGAYRVYAYPFAAGHLGMPLVLELGIDITSRSLTDREHLMLVEELQHTFMEMKNLQRVVPICSCCRQLRTDDLHREQVADYLRNHAGPFAFDLCSSCRQKYQS